MSHEECFTLEMLSARVGIQPRTIRDYRQRGLLPPVRRRAGRLVFDQRHLVALLRIAALQRRGLNLAAIELIQREEELDPDMLAALHVLALRDGATVSVLRDCGIIAESAGSYSWTGGGDFLAGLGRLRAMGVGAESLLVLVARLLEADLIGGASIAAMVEGVSDPVARDTAFHGLVGHVVSRQLGMWSLARTSR
ncbi:MerR family transcriptional regulator [Lentzea alba]|uniref:MerR family transcriptional regulator n=1 Tax=Lentzea alba TaxID=2714351 RepID=UPI0039BF242E